ncbi:hypothetical protein BD413DRAFT_451 [Trametes elegans]|nr:hypothetical protein BD413DRAFT_451 [Trametes elegans]
MRTSTQTAVLFVGIPLVSSVQALHYSNLDSWDSLRLAHTPAAPAAISNPRALTQIRETPVIQAREARANQEPTRFLQYRPHNAGFVVDNEYTDGTSILTAKLSVPPNHPAVLVRDTASNNAPIGGIDPSLDTCQIAVDMLREDLAGHGLPLTILVIVSSSSVLLAGFVLYSFIWRWRIQRKRRVCFTPPKPRLSIAVESGDSIFKNSISRFGSSHPVFPAFSRTPEDTLPCYAKRPPSEAQAPTLSPLLPPHIPLSPLRPRTPNSPVRSIFCSRFYSTGSAAKTSDLEKKLSFLPLQD